MNPFFDSFMTHIPQDIQSRTKMFICQHLVIFEPEEYVIGKKVEFEDYHFVLFFSNSPVTTVNDVDFQFKKGTLLAIEPSDTMFVPPTNTKKWGKYLAITVKKDFFSKIALQISGEENFTFIRRESVYSKQLLDLIGSIQRELMNYGEQYPLIIDAIATQFVFQLIRDMNTQKNKNNQRISKENKYIGNAVQFMQDYYSSNISINDICNSLYLSPCHFKRIFKENTGQSPHQFLLEIRLNKAKEFLKNKHHSIEEIARLCGFINTSHFSTAFKRHEKITPSDYRKLSG